MLGKTFKGMTDEMLAWQTERLLELEEERDRALLAASASADRGASSLVAISRVRASRSRASSVGSWRRAVMDRRLPAPRRNRPIGQVRGWAQR